MRRSHTSPDDDGMLLGFAEAMAQTTTPLPQIPGLTVRAAPCKTILNKGGISDYSLNCYTGCSHACAYCYARYMLSFHPHAEPWGRFVDVKTNAVEMLERQLRSTQPGHVFVSSACDGWQPLEEHLQLTRRCCERLIQHGFTLFCLTKNSLIQRDFDLFAGKPVTVGVTLTTMNDALRAEIEPGTSSVAERVRVLREAKAAGLRTSVMFGPLLPGLSDDEKALGELFECAADCGVDGITTDALNLRSGVWPAISEFLTRYHPRLLPLYRRILFKPEHREAYLRDLRGRIQAAASRGAVGTMLSGCEA